MNEKKKNIYIILKGWIVWFFLVYFYYISDLLISQKVIIVIVIKKVYKNPKTNGYQEAIICFLKSQFFLKR